MRATLNKATQAVGNWWRDFNVDPFLMLPLITLLLIGLLAQSSVAEGAFFNKHLLYILLGLPIFYLGYSLSSQSLRRIGWWLYALALVLLLWVAIQGTTALGAQRWLTIGGFSMQPSEPAKIASILALASWFARRPPRTLWHLILAGVAVMLGPFVLIFSQPDLGTSLVLVTIYFAIAFWARASLLLLGIILSPALLLLLTVLGPRWEFGFIELWGRPLQLSVSYLGLGFILLFNALLFVRYRVWTSLWRLPWWIFYLGFCVSLALFLQPLAWDTLEPYQQKRLTIFLYPESDPKGAGYNILQSLIAIGGGRLLGQGYQQGQLTQGAFVPEQHTDFIFSSLAEEWGFLGVSLVILLFFGICLRLYQLLLQSKDDFQRLVVAGVLAMFAFHVVVNIGMNMALLPVTGVPLPFLSYGGTAIWMSLFSLGITQRIYADNNPNYQMFRGRAG